MGTGAASRNTEWSAALPQEVFDFAYQRCIPIAVTMAGGYGNNIDDTVAVHAQTIALAARHAQRWAARESAAAASTSLPLSA